MATGNVTTTTVATFIPEIWSKEVILTAVNSSVFTNLVRTDFTGDISEAGDIVHVPLFSAVTTGNKTANTEVTFTNYTESVVDITIDKHKYFALRVEDIAQAQSSPDLLAGYTTQGGRALAKDIDSDIAALGASASITQTVGAQTSSGAVYTDITDAVIRNAIQLLDEANAPDDGQRYLVISPAQKNAMLGIAKFVEADKRGDGGATLRTGLFGEIYNVKVYISNNLTNTASVASVASVASSGGASEIVGVTEVLGRMNCIMFHKEAFAYTSQWDVRVQADYNLSHLATEVVGDTLYGADILRADFAVQVRTTVE